ncbi:hypothetical protein R5R35_011233 [Gryllus longicercus]|uniref:Uncharacterized protein n=1 Tax=Gryllus longicercus TaxID=2509291 RepID=A0AAN9V1F4_9ORTH
MKLGRNSTKTIGEAANDREGNIAVSVVEDRLPSVAVSPLEIRPLLSRTSRNKNKRAMTSKSDILTSTPFKEENRLQQQGRIEKRHYKKRKNKKEACYKEAMLLSKDLDLICQKKTKDKSESTEDGE